MSGEMNTFNEWSQELENKGKGQSLIHKSGRFKPETFCSFDKRGFAFYAGRN